jgi:hypothetical protein
MGWSGADEELRVRKGYLVLSTTTTNKHSHIHSFIHQSTIKSVTFWLVNITFDCSSYIFLCNFFIICFYH